MKNLALGFCDALLVVAVFFLVLNALARESCLCVMSIFYNKGNVSIKRKDRNAVL